MCTTDGISTFTLYQHDMRQLVTFWLAAFEYAGNGANAASLWSLADLFAQDNPRFDRQRFYVAAGKPEADAARKR
jgi:hypothetical protein